MLTFNLKKIWFDKIKSGEKIYEYREVKPYWTKRLCKELAVDEKELYDYRETADKIIIFKNGYNSKNGRITARLLSIGIGEGKYTDLKIDKDVYIIRFELINFQCPE